MKPYSAQDRETADEVRDETEEKTNRMQVQGHTHRVKPNSVLRAKQEIRKSTVLPYKAQCSMNFVFARI